MVLPPFIHGVNGIPTLLSPVSVGIQAIQQFCPRVEASIDGKPRQFMIGGGYFLTKRGAGLKSSLHPGSPRPLTHFLKGEGGKGGTRGVN